MLRDLVVQFLRGNITVNTLSTWREAILFEILVALYKGGGSKDDLRNFRGTVLIDVVSKVVSR